LNFNQAKQGAICFKQGGCLQMDTITRVERIPLKSAPPVGTPTFTFGVAIDEKACTGCGICAIQCPSRILKIVEREISPVRDSACTSACPAGNGVRNAIKALSETGDFEEAWKVFTQTNPLPAVTGRVCPHPCEANCNRSQLDEAVNINQCERSIGDYGIAGNLAFKKETGPSRGKVAVIGAGPSGMSCAYHLKKAGYEVTVFEANAKTGGMLRYGIPKYRLPEAVLDKEFQRIIDLGVEVRCNTRLGKDITLDKIREEYKAVYLALGAQSEMLLGLEGEKAKNSLSGLEYLKGIAEGKTFDIGKKVLVIGGGNVAIDVARSALRSGAETVTMVCLEQLYEMPAWESEIEEAKAEGIQIVNGYGPCELINGNGRVSKVAFKRCTSVFDLQSRFSPTYDENDRIEIAADGLVVAIGQKPDCSFIAGSGGVTVGTRGHIEIINPNNLATSIEGIFAGGDVTAMQGTGTVAGGIGMGRIAALAIDSYLGGKALPVQEKPKLCCNGIAEDRFDKKVPRNDASVLPVGKRFLNRDEEVNVPLSKAQVIDESKRCLVCGTGMATYTGPQCSEAFNMACNNCHKCFSLCPDKAITFNYYTRKENGEWR
jgi:NADPH-dependent glutamate synthase beta subunit-like oxidoreductase/NAD-dependent dihydropyrimidine dehydrogenase PreA subunit